MQPQKPKKQSLIAAIIGNWRARRKLKRALPFPLLHEQSLEEQQRVAERSGWSKHQLNAMCRASKHGLLNSQIMHGIFDAVGDSGIDLSDCRSEVEVKNKLLDVIQRGMAAKGNDE